MGRLITYSTSKPIRSARESSERTLALLDDLNSLAELAEKFRSGDLYALVNCSDVTQRTRNDYGYRKKFAEYEGAGVDTVGHLPLHMRRGRRSAGPPLRSSRCSFQSAWNVQHQCVGVVSSLRIFTSRT